MLVRRSTLLHPNGSSIDMPRLIPSFTSKGFQFHEVNGKRISKVSDVLVYTGADINDSILFSAYDIYHKNILNTKKFYTGKEIIFIDSGGYELSDVYDSTEPNRGSHVADKSYDKEAHIKVLKALPKKYPISISNFDHDSRGKKIKDQILEAQKLFNKFPDFIHDFIIKPSESEAYLNMDDIIRHLDKMRKFSILGVTEKELGHNILYRMINLAKLRIAMNEKDIESQIHVWGGLDPVISILYFIAGAELFDGVSWMRYGYFNDTAITSDSYTALYPKNAIQSNEDAARVMRLTENILYLEDLTTKMREFADDSDRHFEVFGTHAKAIEKCYRHLTTKVRGS